MKNWFRSFRARYPTFGPSLQRVHLGLEIAQFIMATAAIIIVLYLWFTKRGERS